MVRLKNGCRIGQKSFFDMKIFQKVLSSEKITPCNFKIGGSNFKIRGRFEKH